MKALKLLLLLMGLSLTLAACTKQSLNDDDELLIKKSDVIYATGGQDDQIGEER